MGCLCVCVSRCLGLKATDIGPPLTRDLCKTVAMTTKVLCRLVYMVRLERLYMFFVRLQRVGENCLAVILHHLTCR